MDPQILLASGVTVLPRIPWILVAIIGIIIAATRLQQHPRVAQLVIIALCIELALNVFGTILSVMLPFLVRDRGSTTELGMLMGGFGLCTSFIGALALALMLWAALGWRNSNHKNLTS